MHKKGTLENGYLVGAKLAPESGFRCEKAEISYLKPDPKDYPAKLHIHEKMDETVIVLKGRFVVEMDAERIEIFAGEYVYKTAGSAGRALAADPGTEILIVKAPSVEGDARIIE
jgi:mannose-6-phosphate isomerase-like protein (cupin superfamily)